MTKEDFIKEVRKKNYPYIMEDVTMIFPSRIYNIGFDSNVDSIPANIEFRNGGNINFAYVTSISSSVKFMNEGDVFLGSLIGKWFGVWEGNIEGVRSNRLLNLMIKKRLFER
jgi:hypothetical protein